MALQLAVSRLAMRMARLSEMIVEELILLCQKKNLPGCTLVNVECMCYDSNRTNVLYGSGGYAGTKV